MYSCGHKIYLTNLRGKFSICKDVEDILLSDILGRIPCYGCLKVKAQQNPLIALGLPDIIGSPASRAWGYTLRHIVIGMGLPCDTSQRYTSYWENIISKAAPDSIEVKNGRT